MATLLEPMPISTRIASQDGIIGPNWARWLELVLVPRIDESAQTTQTLDLTDQQASIPLTELIPSAQPSVYRITYFARVTQAASSSSGLTVAITATDGAVSYTQSSATVTGNTTATVLTGSIILRSDAGAPISYATTYASVGGTVMIYDISFTAEQLT